jgi:biotin carboxylase
MMHPWFIFIESNTTGTGQLFVRAARELGCRPVLLTLTPERYRYVAEENVEVVHASAQEPGALLSAAGRLAESAPIAGAFSSSEHFIEAAADLARELNLPGPDPACIKLCRNKRAQRFALAGAGGLNPHFVAVRNATGLAEIAPSLRFPLVVKPVCGTGSVGVRLCVAPSDLMASGERLLKAGVNERGMAVPAEILVEEYLDGPEYSVELFDGQVVGVIQKHLSAAPFFIEVGHDCPARLDKRRRASVEECARRATALLGLDWGPVHVELRVPASGVPKIIEVNPRLAGGFIPKLVRLASGIDLIRATIQRAMGDLPDLTRKSRLGASIRFLLASRTGVLAAIDGLDYASSLPGVCDTVVYRSIGERLSIHGDFRDRIGHVIATGPTANVAAGNAARAIAAVRPVVTEAS